MRSAICPDGKRRILTKIEVPMDIEDITRYAFESVVREHNLPKDEYIVRLKNMNKRELLRAAKECIKSNGRNNKSCHNNIIVHGNSKRTQYVSCNNRLIILYIPYRVYLIQNEL